MGKGALSASPGAPGNAPGDAEVVARCREGDERAWSELVERYSRYVYAIAVRVYRLPNADAEDVFSEAFARTYEQLGKLRDDDAFRPWLAQLTRRLCVDRLREGSRTVPTEEMEILTAGKEAGGEEEAIARLDQALSVRGALGSLSEECQETLDRFFARDQSYRAISEATGLPQGTIASRISRCLTKLREDLAE